MKRILKCWLYIFLVLQLFSCKRESIISEPKINITLWNKPLSTIRNNIQGDWNFIKYTGGFADVVQYVNNGELYISGDTVRWWMENHTLEADTIITWIRAKSGYFSDSTYLMYFPSIVGNGYMTRWTVNEIKNDTLITQDDAFDAAFYYFIKK